VVSDGAGNLYVADALNSSLRKIVLATGEVSTFAGNGSNLIKDGIGTAAGFRSPSGVVADGGGSLYVIDTNVVRKVVIATRAVTTLAGNPNTSTTVDGVGTAASFSALAGIAYDAGVLYVSDGETIRKIVVSSGTVTTFAGTAGSSGSSDGVGAAARFTVPLGLVADGAGNLYVADYVSDTVRKIALGSGEVTTVAGVAGVSGSTDGVGVAARFFRPSDLALIGDALYVSDRANATIRKIDLATVTVSTPIGVVGHTGVLLGPFLLA
jgi:sugar lactone lactonase YvrE